MNFRWTYLLWLLSATLILGCPPRSQESVFIAQDWAPVVYDYGGIRVIQTQTSHSPVEVRLVFCGDHSWNTGTSPLLNQLALANIIRGGTSSLQPDEFASLIAGEYAEFSYLIGDGFGWLGFSCLEGRLQPTWDLFSQCIIQPGFNPTTYTAETKELEQNSEFWRKIPITGLSKLVRSKGFGPLPFQTGTVLAEEENVPTSATVAEWYRSTLLGKGRLALVVTGPADDELVVDLLLKGLTDLDHPSWDSGPVAQPEPTSPGIFLEKSPEDQEAIALHLPLVDPKEGQYARTAIEEAAFMIFGNLLAERLDKLFIDDPQVRRNIRFEVFRGTRPGAWLMMDGIQVMPRAELIMSELRRFYQDGPKEGEISAVRRVLLNDQLALMQSNRQQADLWAHEIGLGSLDRWPQVIGAIQSVPEKAVVQTGQTALENLSWFYFGVPSRLDRNSLGRLN